MNKIDVIIVPGGGLSESGDLPIWTIRRLDRALEVGDFQFILTLSAGTPYKPPPLDGRAFPIFESRVAAQYLLKHGVTAQQILTESSSYDTIGNAYFSRVIHVDPGGFQKCLIITSDFHMPRTQAIFNWVYGLEEKKRAYALSFNAVSDLGIPPEIIRARREKEKQSLAGLTQLIKNVTTLKTFHDWLFSQHAVYSLQPGQTPTLSEDVLKTY